MGKTAPDPNEKTELDGIEVPYGKGTKQEGIEKTDLLYNEYIVYDVAQIHCKYLFKVKFNYKFWNLYNTIKKYFSFLSDTIVWNFKKVVASTWEKKILAYLRGAAELMCQGKYLDDLMLIVLLISTTLLLLVTMIWRV